MVKAWYMKDISSDEDQRHGHHLDPDRPVSLDQLEKLGVAYWKIDADNIEEEGKLSQIRKEHGCNYEDQVECHPDTLPDFENKMKGFFREHLHADEAIRFFMAGSGYLDVRDLDDMWIRIELVKGDLIILPAGIYHRFTLDNNNYTKIMRPFQSVPDWTPHYRPADELPIRQEYLNLLKKINEKTAG